MWLYDNLNPNFHFVEGWNGSTPPNPNPDFDGDGLAGGALSGFLVPLGIAQDHNSSKITVFVGEGDASISGDYFEVNGESLSNAASSSGNVWNSASPGLAIPGVDIDTFYINYPTIQPSDASATIDMPTNSDDFMLIYIIISFRSDAVTGGAITYLIR